jgi:choline dehydrogenase
MYASKTLSTFAGFKAPMGPNGSKMAVVDFQGKVYKVRGLRVVDASIFPDAVSAAPNPTVIMAAEKIADQIKKTP